MRCQPRQALGTWGKCLGQCLVACVCTAVQERKGEPSPGFSEGSRADGPTGWALESTDQEVGFRTSSP